MCLLDGQGSSMVKNGVSETGVVNSVLCERDYLQYKTNRESS